MLKRMEECDTYLTDVCRYQHSIENPVKDKGAFSQHCRFILLLQLLKATLLAESSFIFSPGSLHYADVYRRESGRCRTLPFFLTFFMTQHCGVAFISCRIDTVDETLSVG